MYDGPERRSSDHCGLHHENSTKIDRLCATETTMKWIVGITLPALLAGLAFFYNAQKDTLAIVSTDLKDVKALIVQNQVSNAVLIQRIDANETDIKEIKRTIESRHGGR